MPKFEHSRPSNEPTEEWAPENPDAPKDWHVDAFAVNWPLNGDEEVFAHDMETQTLEALKKWGRVDSFKMVFSQSAEVEEGKGRIFPRIDRLNPRAREWFVTNGYFTFNDDVSVITPTKKWMDRFFSN